MTISPLVPLLLAACWVLPAVIVALVYGVRSVSTPTKSASREMKKALKGLRAEVGKPEFDARPNAWRRQSWGGPAEYVQAQATESPYEVMLLTPYAEVSVSVDAENGGTEYRRCSLCLN